MADQFRSLAEIREQLAHYQELLGPKDNERLLVCDTNVLIHGKPFHNLSWNELFSEQKVRLVLPLVILDELDGLKDKGVPNAGGVLRDLDARLVPGNALARIDVRTNVTLQLVDEPTLHERLDGHDDEIVRQAGYFSSMCDGRITMVTRDRGMRVRAEAAGLQALPLPSDYERTAKGSSDD
jgi:predicted ribonuclease YlaK